MKRCIAILLVLCATTLVAQEKKDDDYNTEREFKSKVFVLHNRNPRDLYSTLRLLGSGFKGSAISYNSELHTITVRDFPENVASVEDAVKRLDVAAPAEPDVELKIAILIASRTSLDGAPLPDDLLPVVKQLRSTLRYSSYALMSTVMQRTRSGRVQGSGVADATLLGSKSEGAPPIFYTYDLNGVTVGGGTVDIATFRFSMRVPLNINGDVNYQPVGFETPVTLKPNDKVVIGTTTMGAKAVVVVVTANLTQ